MNPADLRRVQEATVAGHRLTNHAKLRQAEFGLTIPDLEAILKDYDQRYAQQGKYAGAFVHQRGDWAMVVDPTDKVVITVLRRIVQRWEH